VTDLLEDEELVVEGAVGVEDDVVVDAERCKWVDSDGERCLNLLPEGHHPTRRYCEGHVKDGPLRRKADRARKRDIPPVTIKLGTGRVGRPTKLEEDQQRVLDAATAWLGLIAGVLEATGDDVCVEAIKKATPQISLQLALLAKFHPIIVKILAPVEASGEALIWIALLIAASPVVITILTHHNLIDEKTAQRMGMVAAMGSVVGSNAATAAEEAEAA
jgi:hypothetical protein